MRWKLAPVLACCLGMVWCTLVACEPSDPTPVGRGRGIFQRTCSGCHGRDGRGTMRPGLSRPPRDLTNPAFQAQMSDEQLRQSIRVGKGQMPAFGGLMGDEEITNLIAYIRSLAPPRPAASGAGGAGSAGVGGAAPSGAGGAAPSGAGGAAPSGAGGAAPSGAGGAAPLGVAGAGSVAPPAAVTVRGVHVP